MVHLVVLACVLRATTKIKSSTFLRKKCTPEKILSKPMVINELTSMCTVLHRDPTLL